MQRDPQSNIGRTFGSVMVELGGLGDQEGIGTPKEDQQGQLTWTLEGSQGLNHQPKSIQVLDLGPLNLCSRCATQSS